MEAPGENKKLADDDAREVVGRLSEVRGSGASLPSGLRAAAAEADRPDVIRCLRQIADRIEQGASLSEAIRQSRQQMSPMVHGALVAAAESPVAGDVLFDILEHQNEGRWRARQVLASLVYPAVVFGVSVLVFCAIQLTIVRQFGTMFADFGMDMPLITMMGLWWSDVGAWMLLAVVLVVVGSLFMGAAFASRQGWHRFLGGIPLIGAMWRLGGHSEMTRLLHLLLSREIPLSRAIPLACDCCTNRAAAAAWRQVGKHLDQGASFTHAVGREHRVPAEVLTFSDWGEKSQTLADSLGAVSELLNQQAADVARQIQQTLPPLLFAAVLFAIAATAVSMFLPLASLLWALS